MFIAACQQPGPRVGNVCKRLGGMLNLVEQDRVLQFENVAEDTKLAVKVKYFAV